jgi:hypothetical protein
LKVDPDFAGTVALLEEMPQLPLDQAIDWVKAFGKSL